MSLSACLSPRTLPISAERILFAHVVGIVGAEQHVSGPVLIDHVAQHLRVEGDGVEVHFRKVVGRRPLDHGAAVGPCAVAMVHARPVMGKVAAGVRQDDLELRVPLHYAIEDQVARRDRRLQRIADHVVEVMIEQTLALREADRMHEDDDVERLRVGEELLQVQPRVREVRAVHAGVDFHPRRPSCLTQRSSSATARSTCCSGTVPSATKRSGQVATISASRSFTMRDSSTPSSGSVQ